MKISNAAPGGGGGAMADAEARARTREEIRARLALKRSGRQDGGFAFFWLFCDVALADAVVGSEDGVAKEAAAGNEASAAAKEPSVKEGVGQRKEDDVPVARQRGEPMATRGSRMEPTSPSAPKKDEEGATQQRVRSEPIGTRGRTSDPVPVAAVAGGTSPRSPRASEGGSSPSTTQLHARSPRASEGSEVLRAPSPRRAPVVPQSDPSPTTKPKDELRKSAGASTSPRGEMSEEERQQVRQRLLERKKTRELSNSGVVSSRDVPPPLPPTEKREGVTEGARTSISPRPGSRASSPRSSLNEKRSPRVSPRSSVTGKTSPRGEGDEYDLFSERLLGEANKDLPEPTISAADPKSRISQSEKERLLKRTSMVITNRRSGSSDLMKTKPRSESAARTPDVDERSSVELKRASMAAPPRRKDSSEAAISPALDRRAKSAASIQRRPQSEKAEVVSDTDKAFGAESVLSSRPKSADPKKPSVAEVPLTESLFAEEPDLFADLADTKSKPPATVDAQAVPNSRRKSTGPKKQISTGLQTSESLFAEETDVFGDPIDPKSKSPSSETSAPRKSTGPKKQNLTGLQASESLFAEETDVFGDPVEVKPATKTIAKPPPQPPSDARASVKATRGSVSASSQSANAAAAASPSGAASRVRSSVVVEPLGSTLLDLLPEMPPESDDRTSLWSYLKSMREVLSSAKAKEYQKDVEEEYQRLHDMLYEWADLDAPDKDEVQLQLAELILSWAEFRLVSDLPQLKQKCTATFAMIEQVEQMLREIVAASFVAWGTRALSAMESLKAAKRKAIQIDSVVLTRLAVQLQEQVKETRRLKKSFREKERLWERRRR